MSSKFSTILSNQAQNDFRNILQYTLERWGKLQVNKYREIIYNALLAISQNNEIGYVYKSYRILKAGKHIIVYGVEDKKINIFRILHERMDIFKYL